MGADERPDPEGIWADPEGILRPTEGERLKSLIPISSPQSTQNEIRCGWNGTSNEKRQSGSLKR